VSLPISIQNPRRSGFTPLIDQSTVVVVTDSLTKGTKLSDCVRELKRRSLLNSSTPPQPIPILVCGVDTHIPPMGVEVVTCPAEYKQSGRGELRVFLAGGITGCPDWQQEVIRKIIANGKCEDIVLLNPKRDSWDTSDKSATEFQIKWERRYLLAADLILFWFPSETLCPITLYELGSWSNRLPMKALLIGAHPNYSRRLDIVVQTALVRPEIKIVDSLDSLAQLTENWYQFEVSKRHHNDHRNTNNTNNNNGMWLVPNKGEVILLAAAVGLLVVFLLKKKSFNFQVA